MLINTLLRKMYCIYFFCIKKIKYPNCEIETNFILPGVKLGCGVIIKKNVKIYRNVSVGSHTFINEDTRIDPNTESIGRFCSISHGVKIGLGPHPLAFFTTSPLFYKRYRGLVRDDYYDEFADKGYTRIGHDVFIAANAVIVSGVEIGHGAVVAAGSIVTKNVPPYAVVGGVPARVIKYRFDESTIKKLLKSQWWNKDINILARNAANGFDIDAFLDSLEE